jgi:hypothetical protein
MKRKLSEYRRGKKHSVEAKSKMAEAKMRSKNAAWKHGQSDLGRDEAERLYPLEGVICEKCGIRSAEHRHHKNEDTFDNSRENIALLCEKCHWEEHR